MISLLYFILVVGGLVLVLWRSPVPRSWFLPVLFITLTFVYASHREAVSFPVSDAIEYSVGASQVAHEESYSLRLGSDEYPPRFDPGFSIFLSPAYLILGDHLGFGIYPALLVVILGILASFALGYLLGGVFGGSFAALFVLSLGSFRYFGSQILTDVPSAALGLVLGLLYLQMRDKNKKTPDRFYLLAGFLAAVACSFRPTNIFFAIPFVLLLTHLKRFFSFALPLLFFFALTAIYHFKSFGSIFRTGYHYWVSVPYDSLSLVFHTKYLTQNLEVALPVFQVLMLLLLVVFVLRCPAQEACMVDAERAFFRGASWYVFLTAAPMVLFYLFYFYSSERFFLYPLFSIGVLLAGRLGGRIRLRAGYEKTLWGIALLLSMSLAVFRFSTTLMDGDEQYQHLLSLRESLPKESILLTSQNPALVEYLVKSSPGQKILPLSRDVEFASKCVAPYSLADALDDVTDLLAHRTQKLLDAGCIDVYPWVPRDDLEQLKKLIEGGSRVFLSSREEWREEGFSYSLLNGSLVEIGVK